MLLCKVALGEIYDTGLKNDSTLKRPPIKDLNNPGLGSYDSVGGITNGSQVYILYRMHVRRAYPAYTLTFEDSWTILLIIYW